jgi:hypothetical protein
LSGVITITPISRKIKLETKNNPFFFPFSVDVSFFGVIFRVCFRNQKQEEGNGKQNMEMFFRR